MTDRTCALCGAPFPLTTPNRIYCSRKCNRAIERAKATGRPPAIPISGQHRACDECGEVFTLAGRGARHDRQFCSYACKARTHRRLRRVRLEANSSPVRFHEIAERDGWRCQLCGLAVRRDAAFPHPLSPTIDHVIPLSKGGLHAPANVQLAHFKCNSKKRAGVFGAGEQLRLIG